MIDKEIIIMQSIPIMRKENIYLEDNVLLDDDYNAIVIFSTPTEEFF